MRLQSARAVPLAVIALSLCQTLCAQLQPQQNATGDKGSPAISQQMALDRVRAAFANLATAPAFGFMAANDAIIEAAKAIAAYANGPASGIVHAAAGDGVNTGTRR